MFQIFALLANMLFTASRMKFVSAVEENVAETIILTIFGMLCCCHILLIFLFPRISSLSQGNNNYTVTQNLVAQEAMRKPAFVKTFSPSG
jgi:hypothetical protein